MTRIFNVKIDSKKTRLGREVVSNLPFGVRGRIGHSDSTSTEMRNDFGFGMTTTVIPPATLTATVLTPGSGSFKMFRPSSATQLTLVDFVHEGRNACDVEIEANRVVEWEREFVSGRFHLRDCGLSGSNATLPDGADRILVQERNDNPGLILQKAQTPLLRIGAGILVTPNGGLVETGHSFARLVFTTAPVATSLAFSYLTRTSGSANPFATPTGWAGRFRVYAPNADPFSLGNDFPTDQATNIANVDVSFPDFVAGGVTESTPGTIDLTPLLVAHQGAYTPADPIIIWFDTGMLGNDRFVEFDSGAEFVFS